ncbi:sperm-associated microtubule inner protein 4 [Petromyzon marinus]|uniref:sperm-associated microtubule inner protein 4 n=1 Tax=Petromyzon marinus TaxID=7757 RepID=UPI003F70FF66
MGDYCCDLQGAAAAVVVASRARRPLSRTFQSSQEFTPMQLPPRVTVSPGRYEAARARVPPTPSPERPPCGRESGTTAARGHLHYGFGGDPVPSGIRIEQCYDLTRLKRSNLRSNDQLLPKPQESLIQQHQARCPFPREHPFASHVSRLALLPSSDAPEPEEGSHAGAGKRAALPRPITVLSKTKGGPYRYEVVMAEPVERCSQWPGDHGFYQMPTGPGFPREVFYPTPPKTVAPNPRPREMTPGPRTATEARNVERCRWRSNYTLNFTGHGPMNPILLDDHHLKLLWSLRSGKAPSNKLVERSLPKFSLARPEHGRTPRFVASGWLRDRFVAECASLEAGGGSATAEEESVEDSRRLAAHLHFADPPAAECAGESGADAAAGDGTAYDPGEDEEVVAAASAAHGLGGDVRYSSGAECGKVPPYCRHLADANASTTIQPPTRQGVERAMPRSTTAANAAEPEIAACQDGLVGFRSPHVTDAEAPNAHENLGLASQIHKNDENAPWSGAGSEWGFPRPHSALDGARPVPGHHRARPQSALSRLQDSFSRSDALRRLHAASGSDPVDLRDHVRSGRQHHFHGFHSYYYHN